MHSKVSELIGKINWLTAQSSFPQLSKLEFDLLMQHVRDLYQELDALRNDENAGNKKPEVMAPIKEKTSEVKSVDPEQNNLLKAEPVRKEKAIIKEEGFTA